MEIINKKINEITPYENNPRRNDNAVKYVVESIKQFGFKVPIVVDKNNIIVAGHTRYKAAKRLGLDIVPCIIADDLNEEQIKAFRLADNKTSEKSEWNFDLLNDELSEILDIDMANLGFDINLDIEEQEAEINTNDGFNYKEQYGVIVMCKNEAEQEEIYNKLTAEGYECKVVAT